MNHYFSLEQTSRTDNLDANLILHQHKLGLMARFMEIKIRNPKIKQKEIAKEVGNSSSTLQRHKNDIKMESPYKIRNSKRFSKSSNDLKRH